MAARPSRRPLRDQCPCIVLKWHTRANLGPISVEQPGPCGAPDQPYKCDPDVNLAVVREREQFVCILIMGGAKRGKKNQRLICRLHFILYEGAPILFVNSSRRGNTVLWYLSVNSI